MQIVQSLQKKMCIRDSLGIDILSRLVCLIGDLLRRKSFLRTLFLHLLHVLVYQIIDIHLIKMTIDKPLLNTSYNRTCDPVNTKTYRECETEYC